MTRRCCLASGFPPHHHAIGCSRVPVQKPCTDNSPPWFVGHWREWHRGHGCDRDDGKPRAAAATTEIAQHTANADTGFLTDAELNHLRASTTSGNTLLCRALDELASRRAAERNSATGHAMQGPPGWNCSCGTSFDDYTKLAEHVRLFIVCPRCGESATDLATGELFRWACGHWIARDASLRSDKEAP